jgi:death-on-curing family protein
MEPEFSHPVIRGEYDHWVRMAGSSVHYRTNETLGIRDVLRAHFLLQDYFFEQREQVGGIGPRDISMLHSTLNRQFCGFGSKDKWQNKFETCATLFFGLVKNHPFYDANKRTALLTCLYHLEHLGRVPTVGETELEQLTLSVAESNLRDYSDFERFKREDDPEVKYLAYFLRRGTREADKRFYPITYGQLRVILERFGIWFGEQQKGYVDVWRNVEEKRLFGLSRQTVTRKIATLGFPGWNAEVGRRVVMNLRRSANLLPEDGCDSDVFFKGRDPLKTYIAKYERPLRRLAAK